MLTQQNGYKKSYEGYQISTFSQCIQNAKTIIDINLQKEVSQGAIAVQDIIKIAGNLFEKRCTPAKYYIDELKRNNIKKEIRKGKQ